MDPRDLYAIQPIGAVGTESWYVLRITIQEDGAVYASQVAEFFEESTAQAFCRAWNGSSQPSGTRPEED